MKTVTAVAPKVNENQRKKLQCPTCGLRDEFPSHCSTPADAARVCVYCYAHERHGDDASVNPFCCICTSREMKARLLGLWLILTSWKKVII